MTPEQALQLVDQVLGSVSGTREDHRKIQTAIEVLAQAITPAPEPPKPTK